MERRSLEDLGDLTSRFIKAPTPVGGSKITAPCFRPERLECYCERMRVPLLTVLLLNLMLPLGIEGDRAVCTPAALSAMGTAVHGRPRRTASTERRGTPETGAPVSVRSGAPAERAAGHAATTPRKGTVSNVTPR
jgi:hypothetical protein